MKKKGSKKMPKVIHNPMLTMPALTLSYLYPSLHLCYALNFCFILRRKHILKSTIHSDIKMPT